ncbi:MAG: fumarylacetoacetate hydrolase family protein [Pseudomonadota bacterium]
MKLRRRLGNSGFIAQALVDGTWLTLGPQSAVRFGSGSDPVMEILKLDAQARQALERIETHQEEMILEDDPAMLPIQPASFRDFMLFEKHVIDSSRGFVKRFMPRAFPLTQLIERVTGKPFKRFRPHPLWYQQPIYYFGNHLNFAPSGSVLKWPRYTTALDYELELGAVLAKPLFNASPDEVADAIGGFVVLNDVSARDIQKEEMDSGFGPQKAKHFVSTMSDTIVTADEVLPHIDRLSASVSINGQQVAECSTAGMQFSLLEAIAFASKDEQLHEGELFGTGTLPGGTGMENGHWLQPGDTVTLRIDQVGEVSNTIERAV